MKMEKFMEKALEDAGINYESILKLSDEALHKFTEINDLNDSRLFEFSDSGGVPIYCFDGTSDELTNMANPDGCHVYIEIVDGDAGVLRHVMVFDGLIFGWPVKMVLGYIELKSELKKDGMI